MPGLVLLPTSLAPSCVALGQLVLDPLNPAPNSFRPSVPPHTRSKKHSPYKDVLLQDDDGRIISRVSLQSSHNHENLLLVQADYAEHISLQNPIQALNTLTKDPAAQTFLQQASQKQKTLYFITSIQTLKNPVYKHIALPPGSLTEANADPTPHPRRDSGADLENTITNPVIAVEYRKVRCHVGCAEAPHSLDDIGYEWTYFRRDDDDQLSVGLGKAVNAAELRAMAGMVRGEDFTDRSCGCSTDGEVEAEEEEGVGGF